jgi:Zn-finger nucleic acid-binding protein
MKCPRCDGLLDSRERQGVTVDVCGRCRGIWLDRGELEKLLSYARRELDEDRAFYEGRGDRERYDRERYDREPPSSDRRAGRPAYGANPSDRSGHAYPRKKSWIENLGDLFD